MSILPPYMYSAKIDRWVDGDTVDVWIDLGFRIHTHQRLRLLDVDTPEVRGLEKIAGAAATTFVNQLAPPETQVLVSTMKTGKYGRWLAEIWVEGKLINSELVKAGHTK